MEIMIVDIDARANVTVGVEGVSGPGCRDLTRAIEAAIGRTTADAPTTEFYQEENASAGQSTGLG